jgi:hypothetical protein
MLIDIDGKMFSLRRLRCFLTSDGVRFFRQLDAASAGLDGRKASMAVSEAFTLSSEELVRLIVEEQKPLPHKAKRYDVFAPALAIDITWPNRLLVHREEVSIDYIDLFLYRVTFHNLNTIKQSGNYSDRVKLVEDVLRFALFFVSCFFCRKATRPSSCLKRYLR